MSYTLDPRARGYGNTASLEVRPGRSVHHVRPGETLDTIARMHGTTTSTLIGLNNHQLGSNGNGLQPGMRLEI